MLLRQLVQTEQIQKEKWVFVSASDLTSGHTANWQEAKVAKATGVDDSSKLYYT